MYKRLNFSTFFCPCPLSLLDFQVTADRNVCADGWNGKSFTGSIGHVDGEREADLTISKLLSHTPALQEGIAG